MPFTNKKPNPIRTDSLKELGTSVVDLAKYIEDEFGILASALQSTEAVNVWNTPPPKPRRGTMAYADGVHWNPGSGEGFYEFNGAVWIPMFASSSSPVVTSIAGNTGAFTLNATSGITNLVNDIRLSQASASQFGVVKVDNATIAAAAGVISANLTRLTNSLGADVNLSSIGSYFIGPTVAQGTTGTWFASGSITVLDTAGGANLIAKLWDGTNVIASGQITTSGANIPGVIALSGYLTSPVSDIRISCKDTTSVNGKIKFNQSGESKDATISVIRIA